MKIKIIILIISFLYFSGCDLLRLTPFEVVSWTPGDGYHSDLNNIEVSLVFSGDPDTANIERNFSLTANGSRVRGNFSWDDKKLTFSPLVPFEINIDYTINLSSDAHDKSGLSMDESFIRDFTTRKENDRPVLLSCYPPLYAQINDTRTEVKLEFSSPVSFNTLYSNVSFRPSMTGLWLLDDSGKHAVFTPSEPWTQNTRYEIRVSSSLTNSNGMNLGQDFSSVFTLYSGGETPFLLRACRVTKNGEEHLLEQSGIYVSAAELPVENTGWEKDDKLLLVFSNPVDSLSVKNCISIENASNPVMQTSSGCQSVFIIGLENAPAYENRFTIKIKPGIYDTDGNKTSGEYIYRIFANGALSRPPELAGIRIPMSPKNQSDYNPLFFSNESLYDFIPITDEHYPSGESVKTWIELYFSTAEGASVDIFSFMELFKIETTNNVLSFSARYVKSSGFTINEPHEGMEEYHRIEIGGYIVNSTNYGIINFKIASGLKDNFGNQNENQMRIAIIK